MRWLLLFLWFNNYVDDSQSKQTVENDKASRCMRQFLYLLFLLMSFDMLSSLSFFYQENKMQFSSLSSLDVKASASRRYWSRFHRTKREIEEECPWAKFKRMMNAENKQKRTATWDEWHIIYFQWKRRK